MKNYIRIILSSLLLIWATPSNAEFNFGVGLIVGQVESDGTETEGTAADTSDRTKSFEEAFDQQSNILTSISQQQPNLAPQDERSSGGGGYSR